MYVAFVCRVPDRCACTRNFRLVDANLGDELTSKLIKMVPDLTVLVSPDGRFIAVGREALDVKSASGSGEPKWFGLPESVAGWLVAGWSSDGKWLYLYGRFEGVAIGP